jgi:threonine dehydrogenase-like Zn-dependent dehydrogenase
MKAVVCVPGSTDGTEVADVPDPAPGAGQVVVQVDACGLCGSDVHAIEHGATGDGQILGHEFSGRVVEVGGGVDRAVLDALVAASPLGSCGSCRACVRGLPFQCTQVPNIGLSAPGAYAQYVAVPQEQLVRLPDGVPTELGAHAEPLSVAMKGVELARVGPGDSALVYGVGPIGLNTIIALRLAGVEDIVAAGRRSPGRRAAAAELGAHTVLDTRELGVREYSEQSGVRFSAVLECAAAPNAFADALEVLEPGGVFVEVALTGEQAVLPLNRLVQQGVAAAGSCAFDFDTYSRAVAYIASGAAPVEKIISSRVDMAATPGALAQLRTPGDLVRVLTRPWD